MFLVALALSGRIRLDFEAQGLVVFGHYVWSHEIALILLLTAAPFVVLAGFSLFFGRAFCGWLCPQTLLSEMATWVQGRVATLRRRGRLRYGLAAAGAVLLAIAVASLGAAVALVPLLPPRSIQDLAAGSLNTSLLKAMTVVALLILVDVGLFRHTFCEWLCVVGWWQRLFAGGGALRVRFDLERAGECTRCAACQRACFMGIEPRRRSLPGTCLNCGECVKACDRQMARVAAESLIRYSLANRAPRRSEAPRPPSWQVEVRLAGYCLLLAVFAALFAWVLWSRPPVQLQVRQAEPQAVTVVGNRVDGAFVIDLYNASDSEGTVHLQQVGLPPEGVTIVPNPVPLPPGGRAEATLRFAVNRDDLQAGRNSFSVTAQDGNGQAAPASRRVTFGLPSTLP